jgi:hypothetical protein
MLTDHARQASAVALSTLSAVLPPSTRLHLQTRATAILLALIAPHLYRDVWPLRTPGLQPLDSREGAVLWAALVLCAPHPSPGFLVPVLSRFTDRAPQTASMFLRLTSAFVSPHVTRAFAQPVLDAADLPPLTEADRDSSLVRTAYPVLVDHAPEMSD